MDEAFKQHSSASRFHLFELFLGFALAICLGVLAKMYYEGALSKQQKKKRLQVVLPRVHSLASLCTLHATGCIFVSYNGKALCSCAMHSGQQRRWRTCTQTS